MADGCEEKCGLGAGQHGGGGGSGGFVRPKLPAGRYIFTSCLLFLYLVAYLECYPTLNSTLPL